MHLNIHTFKELADNTRCPWWVFITLCFCYITSNVIKSILIRKILCKTIRKLPIKQKQFFSEKLQTVFYYIKHSAKLPVSSFITFFNKSQKTINSIQLYKYLWVCWHKHHFAFRKNLNKIHISSNQARSLVGRLKFIDNVSSFISSGCPPHGISITKPLD